MRFLDLFSGIGGFALGLERAGMQVATFCEIDPYRQQVLRKHWPRVPIFGDIRELTREKLIETGVLGVGREIDLVCGGFPCQPFSVAGKRRGTADDRYLWPEMFRVIKALRPTWVLGENVANIVNMALDIVLSDLESEGYETATFVIPACAVGAPHRRDRVWIVAYNSEIRCNMWRPEGQGVQRADETRNEVDSGGQDVGNSHGLRTERQRAKQQATGFGRTSKNVAHAASEGLEREVNQTRQVAGCGKRVTQSRLGRMLDGISSWLDSHRWPAPFGCEQYDWEPPRLAQGRIPHRRERLMALGDAVVPQVAEAIGRAIMSAYLTLGRGRNSIGN